MRPPIPRIGMRWRSVAVGLLVLTAVTVGAVRADAATYPNPGVVTGAISGVDRANYSSGWPYVY
jgi:hypothetical protein